MNQPVGQPGQDKADQARQLRRQIWAELENAATQPQHPWRTPVLASVDTNGLPQARTVVLRDADAGARRLLIYTDQRSPKVSQLRAQQQAVLVFWSRQLQWQLRVQAQIKLQTEGERVEQAWTRICTTNAASDYLSPAAPGSPLADPPQTAGATATASKHSLAILVAEVCCMDWLELSRAGHRRARISADRLEWLVP